MKNKVTLNVKMNGNPFGMTKTKSKRFYFGCEYHPTTMMWEVFFKGQTLRLPAKDCLELNSDNYSFLMWLFKIWYQDKKVSKSDVLDFIIKTSGNNLKALDRLAYYGFVDWNR